MHTPVLLKEVIENLNPQKGEFFIDGTLGGGGHAKAIWEKIKPNGKLLVLDLDKSAVDRFKESILSENIVAINANYADLVSIISANDLPRVDGLLLDLGFSSDQIELSGRGFSFNRDEPLYMTYSEDEESVASILSRLSEKDLADVIYKYGDERFSRKIAKAIKERTQKESIISSLELSEIIRQILPKSYEQGRIDPATRTFQALRIYANHELDNIRRVISILPNIIASLGRVAIITFHSLEDEIVKNSFKELVDEKKAVLVNKKPIVPTIEEKSHNPKSRSAKLRVIKFN
ncbi:MAG: 16S rRNA (cytosine(1402)-N(4))-methyltransferase [Candidatus Liptonbacteria bacterium CG11_big_fil_rev_8_21_14_0_20_35_14]|uniref:Ribosomal RNA small subunit methyltransferase H n=1 Tax=Candidatus Liptonbacteria bacterium CG11_big_fil_rev_8_21_14_0_20_35_14 TaxID=1974634 RepID=A0A2H0N886_9BACT|nr:MAG: 16S rRNA (cytosine(1402)-N(4))-methyltransferase [Candidatus Liptonbacteria bacterium CG11_big_fil_rev_8_21_14_0_20_35_14]